MKDIEVETLADPDLRDPVLVEGLPGVGHVGKLAAEHLLEEFESTLVRRVYADEFPPQVDVDEEGVASLTCAEFHAVDLSTPTPTELDDEDADGDADGEGADDDADDEGVEAEAATNADAETPATTSEGATGGESGESESDESESEDDTADETVPTDRNLLVLTGDHQAQTNAGHYHLTEAFLDIAGSFGVEEAFALGGVPTGELIEEHNVLGAVTDGAMIDRLEDAGVEFRPDEPAGGIVGVSGLLLGLGGRRGLEVACLMGETSGYLVDPKSAQATLEVLERAIGFRVNFAALEKRAEEMEEVVGKIQEMQEGAQMPSDDELRYIG